MSRGNGKPTPSLDDGFGSYLNAPPGKLVYEITVVFISYYYL